ncbi:MAG: hypothetical protein V1861_02050 [Candidatus Micrarchaeota archaeon]
MKLRHGNVSDNVSDGCKGSVARQAEIVRSSKLREFAVAGALGFSLLIGSAGTARAQEGGAAPQPDASATARADAGVADAPAEAAPREAAPASAPAPAAQTIYGLPVALSVPIGSSEHPANVQAPDVLATNVLRMFQLLDILRTPPAAPASGQQASPERLAYDAAIRLHGNSGAAISAVETALVRGIRNLGSVAQSRESMGSDADALEGRLTAVNRAIGNLEASPRMEAAGNSVTCVLRMMHGGEVCTESTAPRTQDRATVAGALPIIEMLPYDFGSQFFLSGFGNGRFVMAEPGTTPLLNSLFGGQDIAQNAMSTWADALETLMNSPNDPAALANAAHSLHNALSQIPSDKQIWQLPQFNSAMAALSNGDLRGGLAALRGMPQLNAVWSNLGSLNQLQLNQRAVARIRAGFMLRFPEGTNPAEFLSFRRGTEGRAYPWDVLYYNIGANYTNLLMSGRLQSYNLDFNTFALTPSGPARAVEGQGHAIDGMAGITFGGTIFHDPVETTLSGRLGYLWWKIGTTDENQRPIEAENSSIYGILNLDVARVGYEGRNSVFRLSRWGLGMFNLNPYAYFTLTGRSFEGNNMRLEHHLTPQYLMFWGRRQDGMSESLFYQHRVAADLRPLDFTIQQGSSLTWYAGPGLHYSWNTEQSIHSFEPYGHASLRWRDGGLAVDARVGYFMEVGGDSSFRAPNTVTGTLNLILTPAEWFRTSSSSGSVRADGGVNTGETR